MFTFARKLLPENKKKEEISGKFIYKGLTDIRLGNFYRLAHMTFVFRSDSHSCIIF